MKILVVDDELGIVETLEVLFRGAGYEVETALGGRAGLEAVGRVKPDVVVSDIRMPGVTGLELLEHIRATDPELPVILMTAQASLQSAVKAVNEGAFYYIQKPFSNDELLAICARAVESRELKVENRTLKRELKKREGGTAPAPIGKARSFTDTLKLARTVAPTDSTVLITGESGTGKEVLAKYMHQLSDRADGPFLSINCGALPESLLESELFGHTKGSFTGAVKDRDGLLVAAEGGTFFLDEVGEMSPQTQVKLLRALQEREVIPVGATQSVPVNVRIIAATNRDLEEQIRRGLFRSDLYYRLNVIAVHLPPLRERKDDIPILANHFLEKMAGPGKEPKTLSDDALSALNRHSWPGNVRELENALERAAVLTGARKEIAFDTLPERVREEPSERLVKEEPPENPSMEVIERAYIEWVLRTEGGNKSKAAEVLGIDPSTLYRKIARYGLAES
ncbi:MAG: sigma-54-dependent Fis family transcriptional regulator [Gemmatimonadales bacterium]|nr:MAG: sigma-54-dependent Fis family transcriptional regulator [Gemmatimonadales bacterium]